LSSETAVDRASRSTNDTAAPPRQKVRHVRVSVIVPARNEEEYIESCINSIKSQDFRDYEIIVVDNGSTDDTADTARSLGVKVVSEPRAGLPRARERGRRAARGNILVYLDADTIIPPTYLSRIVRCFEERRGVVAVSNPYMFYDGDWRINALGALFFKVFLPMYSMLLEALHVSTLLGGNFAIRQNALEKIGGFNEGIEFYGEDADISKRISKQGDVVFMRDLCTLTSARRYLQQGIWRTSFIYFANHLSVLLLSHPFALRAARPVRSSRYATIMMAATVLAIGLFVYGFAYSKSGTSGGVIHRMNRLDNVVALTFDDGPNGEYTQEVLDILDREGIKGTFFLIGKNVEVYPQIARRIVESGHCIGNHSYSHQYRLPFKTAQAVRDEVDGAEEAIYRATGVRPKLFRPPHGFKTPWMMHTIRDMGYKTITWDDMTTDYLARSKPEHIAKRIVDRVKPGSIIVLHDGLNLNHGVNRENTVEALEIIIKELRDKGYSFVSLQEIEETDQEMEETEPEGDIVESASSE
jgi:peptidoglycan/xylan/chitin deacetylase (PgdA/CDA1 family)